MTDIEPRELTKVERLRIENANDFERGNMCLGWAEQARNEYEKGKVATILRDTRKYDGSKLTPALRAQVIARAESKWSDTVAAKDLKADAVMYGEWSNNYFLAYTARMTSVIAVGTVN